LSGVKVDADAGRAARSGAAGGSMSS